MNNSKNHVRRRFVAALRAFGAGTWTWDVRRDRVDWDEALCAVYHVETENAPRSSADFLSLVHPDDRARIWAIVEKGLLEEFDLEYEFRTVLNDGSVRWIYDRSTIERDPGGQPIYLIGACLDITNRKLSELALKDSETRLELATTAAEIGVWDWDLATGDIIYCERAKSICGFPALLPVSFEQVRNVTHPEDLSRTSAMARRALDPLLREQVPYEYRIIRPDGETRWILARGQAVFDSTHGELKAVRYVGTIRDITARRMTEDALRDSEGRLRLAIDAGRMAIWEYDVIDDSVVTSPELNLLLGFAKDVKPSLDDLRAGYFPGEQERVHAAGLAALAKGERFFEVEYRYFRRDGSLIWLLLRADILADADRRPKRVIGVLLDITVQKQAFERQQLLTNELNHRVKNTLATVQSVAAQTLRYSATISEAQANLQGRIQSLARAHDLLSEQDWQRAEITEIVERALRVFSLGRNRVRQRGPQLWVPPRSAVDLAMILHELVTNAMKYGALSIPGGIAIVEWQLERRDARTLFCLRWEESGGPEVLEPVRTGFGLQLLKKIATHGGGSANVRFDKAGFKCRLELVVPTGQESVLQG